MCTACLPTVTWREAHYFRWKIVALAKKALPRVMVTPRVCRPSTAGGPSSTSSIPFTAEFAVIHDFKTVVLTLKWSCTSPLQPILNLCRRPSWQLQVHGPRQSPRDWLVSAEWFLWYPSHLMSVAPSVITVHVPLLSCHLIPD